MTDVIFQEVIVKTDLPSIKYQIAVRRRMQDSVYLVADQMVVASFKGIFPESNKEALLQVKCKSKYQEMCQFKGHGGWVRVQGGQLDLWRLLHLHGDHQRLPGQGNLKHL